MPFGLSIALEAQNPVFDKIALHARFGTITLYLNMDRRIVNEDVPEVDSVAVLDCQSDSAATKDIAFHGGVTKFTNHNCHLASKHFIALE
mmetsp:Transcript_82184/g.145192  ORF Transcript_82184/g.145192 Transcript_82184/m.145192 type:complete len:90 (-) Transcript_82184:659-928(-)